MAKLNIPDDYVSGIKAINDMEPSDVAHLCDVLRNIPSGIGHDLFVKSVSESFNISSASDVAETVFSFGGLLIKEDYPDPEEIAQDLVLSYQNKIDDDDHLDESRLKDLTDRLTLILLSASNIKTTFQAYTLIRSYQNPVIGTSITPDHRIIFPDVQKKKPNGFTFFNLKFSVLVGNESSDRIFTLDSDDIHKLKAQLEKAIAEEIKNRERNSDFINFIEITE
jgi:hypothetical protein